VVPCPYVAPYIDSRFDSCDLLQRSVIHYGAERKASSALISTPVPIVNLIRWRDRPNRAMFLPDVGRLQIDLVAADRAIPIESNA
jgi:hypothetical protein